MQAALEYMDFDSPTKWLINACQSFSNFSCLFCEIVKLFDSYVLLYLQNKISIPLWVILDCRPLNQVVISFADYFMLFSLKIFLFFSVALSI